MSQQITQHADLADSSKIFTVFRPQSHQPMRDINAQPPSMQGTVDINCSAMTGESQHPPPYGFSGQAPSQPQGGQYPASSYGVSNQPPVSQPYFTYGASQQPYGPQPVYATQPVYGPQPVYTTQPVYGQPPVYGPQPMYGPRQQQFVYAQYGSPPPPGGVPFVAQVEIKSALEDPLVRSNFIQKTYTILSCQLIFSFTIVAICCFVPEVQDWIKSHFYFIFLFFGVYIIVAVVMCCNPQMLQSPPSSYVLLVLVTLSMAGMTGWISSTYADRAVLIAMAATLGIVVLLTLLAFQIKYDFTGLMGVMLVVVVLLAVFGLLVIFLHPYVPYINLIYSGVGALVFCVFIVMDTQLMMSGKRYSLQPDMHVFAAINLFLDVMLLFMYLLAIVSGLSDD